MEIKIEKMTLDDLENIKDILESEFDNFWNYNILKQELLNENSYLFVVKQKSLQIENINTIIGFAGVQFILDEANITNIVVKKDIRNQGIGNLLLNKLIDFSKQNNMSNITLEVNENNQYAIKLYNKFNFNITGIRKKYYNGTDNAIIMTLCF